MDEQREAAWDCGIHEREFWRMTPAELMERYEIHHRRVLQMREHAAFIVHYVTSALVGKSAPTIDELMGREQRL